MENKPRNSNTVQVLLVDDHDVVRVGLRTYLNTQPDIFVVGEAMDGKGALDEVENLHPDVVVMDISMPNMDGLAATKIIRQRFPQVHVLALTIHEDKEHFFEMIAAGANGYLTKRTAAEELADAIRTVSKGQVYLQPSLAKWLLDDYRRLADGNVEKGRTKRDEVGDIPVPLDVLSHRERQVLELVAHGLTTPQIAERLNLSPKTVSRHRERIMNKLNMHTAAELVRYAIKTGLIQA